MNRRRTAQEIADAIRRRNDLQLAAELAKSGNVAAARSILSRYAITHAVVDTVRKQ